ncbi:MAG: hypothetical protein JF571_04695 [Asticcacaulis sp.]|nr:hypothetical protein [Asticcacaulis sp.]
MISSTLLRAVSAGAVLAGLALVPSIAAAQAQSRLDGYCYVRKTEMQRNSAVDSYGVKRAFARCYNGVYYAYTGESYSAPAAPDGYQVAYYTSRPGAEYYDRVVDADSHYQSSSSYSSTSTYTGGDRYATTSGYGSSGYGSGGYGSSAYGSDDAYDRPSRGYDSQSDAYDDRSDDGRSYSDDRDDRAYDGDRPARGGYRDPDYTHRPAAEGWRDDSGQWHTGRPRAVGWQDQDGRWHIGSVEAYGWRDARGQWHEARDGGDSTDSRESY